MRNIAEKWRLREEEGFTLTEVLVTMMIMLIVLFALYSLFDMTLRIFSVGNDKVEAIENAQLGMEKMQREIRAAYPQDLVANNSTLLTSWTATSITFGNDLNGNYKVDTVSPSEQITYNLSGSTLQRNSKPAVEFVNEVDTLDGDTTPLTFKYFKRDSTTEVVPGVGTQSDIAIVRIKLEVSVDRGIQEQPVTQILTTDVSLKNRGG